MRDGASLLPAQRLHPYPLRFPFLRSHPPHLPFLSLTPRPRSYATLTETHFARAVLDALPDEQRSLDDQVPFLPPMRASALFIH